MPCFRDMNTDMAQWLRGIKNKVTRVVVERKLVSGEPLDKSCTPIWRVHVKALNRSYAKVDGVEAALRKFAIGQTHRSAGAPLPLVAHPRPIACVWV